MKYLTALCLLAVCFPQTGFTAMSADSVVKIRSFPCGTPERAKQGSGIQLSDDLVLTSDHVIFHDNQEQGICHEAGDKSARLLAVHIGNGMALLSVGDERSTAPLALPSPDQSTVSGFATMAGFPFGSSTLLQDRQSQILNIQSTRSNLPLVPLLIEAKGHNEYGMSGGGLFNEKGELLGMISHQYLKLRLGAPATLGEHSAWVDDRGEMVALIIPARAIQSWIQDVFSANPARVRSANARMDAKAQRRPSDSIVFEGVRFTSENCTPSATTPGVGGDGVGIGGDGVGIGGDGVGIGGGAKLITVPCRLRITANTDSKTWDNAWFLPRSPWFTSLRERVLSGAVATIDGLYDQGRREGLLSLIPLLNAFKEGKLPLLHIEALIPSPFPASKIPQEKAQEAKSIIAAFDSQLGLSPLSENADPQAMHRLLADLDFSLDQLLQTQFGLPISARLKTLLSSKAWDDLAQVDFDACVRLKSLILKITAGLTEK